MSNKSEFDKFAGKYADALTKAGFGPQSVKRIVTKDMTNQEIFELTYQQAQEDAENKYGPCSVDQYSEKWSSVNGNLITLCNGAGLICQYNITKDGELRPLRS